MANDPFGGAKDSKFPYMLSELRSGKPGALLRREKGVWSLLSEDGKTWVDTADASKPCGIDLGDVRASRPLMDSEIEALIESGMPAQ